MTSDVHHLYAADKTAAIIVLAERTAGGVGRAELTDMLSEHGFDLRSP